MGSIDYYEIKIQFYKHFYKYINISTNNISIWLEIKRLYQQNIDFTILQCKHFN